MRNNQGKERKGVVNTEYQVAISSRVPGASHRPAMLREIRGGYFRPVYNGHIAEPPNIAGDNNPYPATPRRGPEPVRMRRRTPIRLKLHNLVSRSLIVISSFGTADCQLVLAYFHSCRL